jgi:REP element-mobilizing transposase RayT
LRQHRRSIRLNEYDYATPWWYYITICTFERKILFGDVKDGKMILNDLGKIVEEEWLRTKEVRSNVDLDYYVIMPNHLHGNIIITSRGELNSPQGINPPQELNSPRRIDPPQRMNLPQELNSTGNNESGRIQYAPTNDKFKSPSQTLGAIIRGFKASVTARIRKIQGNSRLIIWQRNYYEHIIRNEIDLQNIRNYIELNPLKWELDEHYKPVKSNRN